MPRACREGRGGGGGGGGYKKETDNRVDCLK